MKDFYARSEKHHTLDCNEGAIYGGGCECKNMCAKEWSGVGKRSQDIHICDKPKNHIGEHKCGCGRRRMSKDASEKLRRWVSWLTLTYGEPSKEQFVDAMNKWELGEEPPIKEK